MSGVRNLANAIANDPSFAKQTKGVLSASEAKEFVCEDKGAVRQGPGVPRTPRPRSY